VSLVVLASPPCARPGTAGSAGRTRARRSPRYFTADLNAEIGRRLQDRVMFGADYPMFAYERLIADWRAERYGEDVLEKVFHRNAERLFAEIGGGLSSTASAR
jgi:predicted TIM-barrel fold metal-dependent hydrolase